METWSVLIRAWCPRRLVFLSCWEFLRVVMVAGGVVAVACVVMMSLRTTEALVLPKCRASSGTLNHKY